MTVPIVASLFGAVALVLAMFILGGRRNVLAYVASYFVFFAFGPAINLIYDREVYEGTVYDTADEAALGFFLAVLGMFLADRILSQRSPHKGITPSLSPRNLSYPLLKPAIHVLTAYGVVMLATAGPAVLSLTKHGRIDALGPGHRTYLLLETFVVALYFLARSRPKVLAAYKANVAVYVAYCLLSAERDFIFALFALVLVKQLLDGVPPRLTRSVAYAVGLLALAVLIVSNRSGRAVTATSVLNEGSILFVDSYVRSLVPESIPFKGGETYVNTVLNLLPSFVYSTDFSLASWFKSLYAPTGHSGYGFSLSAEAYLNFGTFGIPIVFFLIAISCRLCLNTAHDRQFFQYIAVVFVTVFMYAIRGDSLQLVKTLLYGTVFYAAMLSIISRSGSSARRAKSISKSSQHWGADDGHEPTTP